MKTWQEKLADKKTPVLKTIEKGFAGMPAGALMYISTPQEIDALVKKIPRGQFVEPAEMRARLAAGSGATHTCPVTTGIFLRIVAEAALEALQAGVPVPELTPFWRAVAADSNLAGKLTGGKDFLIERQREEGIER